MSEFSVGSILIFAVIVTILMIFVSLVVYLSDREKKSFYILEFWLAYGTYFLISFITDPYPPQVVALSTITWLWRVRTIRLVLESMARKKLSYDWHHYLLGGSYVLGASLAICGFPFEYFTMPMSLATFFVGINILYSTFNAIEGRKLSPIHYMLLVNVLVIFIHILDYPMLRFNHDLTAVGFGIVLVTTILMAIFVPAVTFFELQRDYHFKLENLVHERSAQLVTQSKMSALGEMSSGMAHEINNPLSIIAGRASQLKRSFKRGDASNESLVKGLEQIEQTGERITKIIKGLQAFSSDSKSDQFQKVTLEHLMTETLTLSQDHLKVNGVKITVNRIPDIQLVCRSFQVTQVFVNLLNNACDAIHSLEDKWVKIEFKEIDNEIEIRVFDSGRGIPESVQEKMMQPFFTTKEVGKGTGLGLSISRGIIEEHYGSFYYDPSEKNTCFVVLLPKASVQKGRPA